MRISISIISSNVEISSDFISLDVFPDMTLNDLKALVEAEINVPTSSQHFIQNGQPVQDTSKTLAELGIGEGEVVAMAVQDRQISRRRPAQDQEARTPAQRQRSGNDPESIRLQLLGNSHMLAECRSQDPELAEAASDSDRFRALWDERQRRNAELQREKEEQIALLEADPFNVDAQTKIEEMIRQERVQENLQKAMEENPESFGRVTMLYIDATVNNTPIKAFVDSGAQSTIMSPDAAERCGILRLIDKRWSGVARGVGTAKILGRVHTADIQIGQYSLASSFTVMEGKDVDLLLGLDMLKRHQMCIDLAKNCLRVQDEEVPFLPESEIPKMMDAILDEEPKVEGPGGSTIGTKTGTLQASSESSAAQQQRSGTASGSASQQQSASASNFGQGQPITAESIAKITELGFSREEAIAALRQVDGNVELAIGLLI